MIRFLDYYNVISEATFRQSKQVNHLYDLQMFSVYVHKSLDDQSDRLNNPKIKESFKTALREITKMGFPSMHVNVLFNGLSDTVNQNTGGGVAGQAHRKEIIKLMNTRGPRSSRPNRSSRKSQNKQKHFN